MDGVSSLGSCTGRAAPHDQDASQIVPPHLLIPCWESQRADPEEKRGPASDISRSTTIDSLTTIDTGRPNREDPRVKTLNCGWFRSRLQGGAACRATGVVQEEWAPHAGAVDDSLFPKCRVSFGANPAELALCHVKATAVTAMLIAMPYAITLRLDPISVLRLRRFGGL